MPRTSGRRPRLSAVDGQTAIEVDEAATAPAAKRAKPKRPPKPIAEVLPVAQVRIDTPVPHLDRVFDYLVPAALDEACAVGVRVRVRFAGRLVGGIVVGRAHTSDTDKQLRPVDRVVSPEPVLTPATLRLVDAVAEHYAGTFSDVVRLAVPPRHARAEAAVPSVLERPLRAELRDVDASAWSEVEHGATFFARAAGGALGHARAVWSAPPGRHWSQPIAELARAVLASDSDAGVLIVAPDAADVAMLARALDDTGDERATLSADMGPERRYREFLRVLRGHARIVIGTRTAVFAPVRDLRLVIVWNDAEDTLWEPHAPYWNARDVAAIRSHLEGCALLIASPARSVEAQALVERGWATSLEPTRAVIRERGPVVRAVEPGDIARDEAAATARLPRIAWMVAKDAVRTGPVLVQVGRRGYLSGLACQRCRERAVCTACGGPLVIAGRGSVPSCQWCGTPAPGWRCPACGDTRLRAVAVGAERTAEEFGRAFPEVPVIWSSADQMRRTVPDKPALVVATPGAEPVAARGYAAGVILDAAAALARPGLRAREDVVARWFAALALMRPRAQVAFAADNALPAVQALVRWDAAWLAQRELTERTEAGLPPATRMAVLCTPGEHADAELLAAADSLRVPHRRLGPSDGRLVLLVEREHGADLARELRAMTVIRSTRGLPVVTVALDPRDL